MIPNYPTPPMQPFHNITLFSYSSIYRGLMGPGLGYGHSDSNNNPVSVVSRLRGRS